jgi:hypothetical protein
MPRSVYHYQNSGILFGSGVLTSTTTFSSSPLSRCASSPSILSHTGNCSSSPVRNTKLPFAPSASARAGISPWSPSRSSFRSVSRRPGRFSQAASAEDWKKKEPGDGPRDMCGSSLGFACQQERRKDRFGGRLPDTVDG